MKEMTSRVGPIWTYLAAALTAIIGIGSLAVFGQFLSTGGARWADMQMDWGGALAWDAALCLVFFLQHSGMVRRPFRSWLTRFAPAHTHGALYTLASAAALVLLSLGWQPSRIEVYGVNGAARELLRGLGLLSLVGFAWTFAVLRDFDTFGARALLSRLRRDERCSWPLTIRGPYRWVRHPLYFFGLVLMWACPTLSLDRLLFNILFSGWIVAGAKLEERDLVAEFGEAYRAYQRVVPMLLPRRLPRPAAHLPAERPELQSTT